MLAMTTRANSPLPRSSCTLALAAICLAAPAAAQDAVRQSELTTLVRQDCGSCHGMTLKGGLGSPLLPPQIEHLEPEGIAQIILDGIPGKPMPPWRGLLSEADARWIAHRLKEGFPQ
jgi:cytochrome c55X